MGYSYGTVQWLAGLGLPPGGRVLDLGSQDLYLGSPVELEIANRLIVDRGGAALRAASFPAQIPTADLWSRAGFSYTCVDVDERPKTVRLDLQSFDFPESMRSRFDLIFNGGTIEHLANPVGGFVLAHFACRVGGIIAHDMPLFGYGNHGLTNPTPKFWQALCNRNQYDSLSASVRQVDEAAVDPNNFRHGSLDFIEGLDKARDVTWMIRIAFRKTADHPFVPPFDPASGASVATLLKLIEGSMQPYAHLWTREQRVAGAASALRLPAPAPLLRRRRDGLSRIFKLLDLRSRRREIGL